MYSNIRTFIVTQQLQEDGDRQVVIGGQLICGEKFELKAFAPTDVPISALIVSEFDKLGEFLDGNHKTCLVCANSK